MHQRLEADSYSAHHPVPRTKEHTMTQTLKPLAAKVLERRVEGRNLSGATLAENLGPAPTLLVFLRHFG